MIKLTKLNGVSIVVNIDLVETVEATPDTVLTFTSGKKLIVAEDLDMVINKTILYKQKVNKKENGSEPGEC